MNCLKLNKIDIDSHNTVWKKSLNAIPIIPLLSRIAVKTFLEWWHRS